MKRMPKDAISTSQEQRKNVRSRDLKKSIGSFYTPQFLAAHISNETLNAWFTKKTGLNNLDERNILGLNQDTKKKLLKLLRDISILDPAVGGGAFLLAAADWLNHKRMLLDDPFTSYERRCDIALNSLYGVDLVEDATIVCKQNLHRWCKSEDVGTNSFKAGDLTKIKKGNSLVGFINRHYSNNEKGKRQEVSLDSFHWYDEFSKVLQSSEPGFDVILGNPPYGNILDTHVRQHIKETYPINVGGGKDGTWNSAAHFIVRSRALMKEGSYLGFLVPNSILRVNQFSKTRRFILDKMNLWKIIDEGSPFDDVTLEMVSLFCEVSDDYVHDQIEIESRRAGHEQTNRINRKVLRSGRVFSIYHDAIFSKILSRGVRNLLTASRGRDIPKEHVSREKSRNFNIPYITSGRSVKRYQILQQHQSYADDWFMQDSRLRESFESELLVATKNYPYPRCVIKSPGMIHGGGIVKITPLFENADLRSLGLILNSHLVRYVCQRYLTNYSQLTTCLNTGIMEDLPIVLPKHPYVFSTLFDLISELYSNTPSEQLTGCRQFLEHLSNALVYELYFRDDHALQNTLASTIVKRDQNHNDLVALCDSLQRGNVSNHTMNIMDDPIVMRIETILNSK